MVTRRRVIAGAGAVIAGLPGLSRADPASGKLRFLTNWYAQAEHGGYYQALATGLYRRAGLDVEIEPGGPQINNEQLLASGDADLAICSDFSVIQGVERGIPVVMLATTFQFSPYCILTHPDVTSLAGLKGHKLLISPAEQATLVPMLVGRYGLDREQIGPYEFNLQPFLLDPNLATQGFVTSEPFDLERHAVAYRLYLLRDAGFPGYGNAIATRSDLLAGRPDLLRAFLAASMQGWKDYFLDPQPADRLILQANPRIDAARLAFSRRQIAKFGLVGGGDAVKGGIGIMSEAKWRDDFEFLRGLGMIAPDTDWRRAFDLRLISGVRVLPA